MGFPFGQTVTLVTRTLSTSDGMGNDTWTETTTSIDGCVVYPQMFARTGHGGTEVVQGGDTVASSLYVLFPPGTAVASTDKVLINGLAYEIQGEGHNYVSPFTGLNPGVEVGVTRVTG